VRRDRYWKVDRDSQKRFLEGAFSYNDYNCCLCGVTPEQAIKRKRKIVQVSKPGEPYVGKCEPSCEDNRSDNHATRR
jgi:hypothetical protein